MTIHKCDLCKSVIDEEDVYITFNLESERHIYWDDGDYRHHEIKYDLCGSCGNKLVGKMSKIAGKKLTWWSCTKDRSKEK